MVMSSDKTVISPEQCRAARAWLRWSQEDLAKRSTVSLSTIKDFEKSEGRKTTANNRAALRRAIEEAGIGLVFDNEGTATGITSQVSQSL